VAFTEQDRTYVRHFVGAGATFTQSVPLVEQAVTAVQSVADGGSRPDSSVENYVKGLIYGNAAVTGAAGVTPGGTTQTATIWAIPPTRGLLTIETSIATLDIQLGALGVGRGAVSIDSAREMIRLRMEGRRLVKSLCRMLGMCRPISDIFSAGYNDEPLDTGRGLFWNDKG